MAIEEGPGPRLERAPMPESRTGKSLAEAAQEQKRRFSEANTAARKFLDELVSRSNEQNMPELEWVQTRLQELDATAVNVVKIAGNDGVRRQPDVQRLLDHQIVLRAQLVGLEKQRAKEILAETTNRKPKAAKTITEAIAVREKRLAHARKGLHMIEQDFKKGRVGQYGELFYLRTEKEKLEAQARRLPTEIAALEKELEAARAQEKSPKSLRGLMTEAKSLMAQQQREKAEKAAHVAEPKPAPARVSFFSRIRNFFNQLSQPKLEKAPTIPSPEPVVTKGRFERPVWVESPAPVDERFTKAPVEEGISAVEPEPEWVSKEEFSTYANEQMAKKEQAKLITLIRSSQITDLIKAQKQFERLQELSEKEYFDFFKGIEMKEFYHRNDETGELYKLGHAKPESEPQTVPEIIQHEINFLLAAALNTALHAKLARLAGQKKGKASVEDVTAIINPYLNPKNYGAEVQEEDLKTFFDRILTDTLKEVNKTKRAPDIERALKQIMQERGFKIKE